MSDAGEISKRNLAQLVADVQARDVGAAEIAMMNLVHTIWENRGAVETDPDVTDEEVTRILSDLPTEWDDWN
jgi:hypothetical protein